MNPGSRRHDTKISENALQSAMQSTMDNIRLRIAYARGRRLQGEVAAAIGVSAATISNIETGEVNVSEKFIREYTEYLKIPRGEELLDVYRALNVYIGQK